MNHDDIASDVSNSTEHRYALVLRTSADNGQTWSSGKALRGDPLANEGTAAGNLCEGGYSALTEARRLQTNDAPAGALDFSPCAVVLRRFDPTWLPRN